MNKLGIGAIAIAGAFLIGVVSANPVVEAVGGWQGAFEELTVLITGLDERVTELEQSSSGSSLTIKQSLVDEKIGLEYKIFDSDITPNSVVILSIDEVIGTSDISAGCGISRVGNGFFAFSCLHVELIIESSIVNYIVIND